MDTNIINFLNLNKNFGKINVLKDINLEIKENEIFALLGLNGAGKTTLIKCIFKFLRTSKGKILYRGRPITFQDIYTDFGYLPENFLPPKELTAKEFLRFLGLSLNISSSHIISLLKEVGLEDKKRTKHYSKGMIQRLGLAVALLKDPKVLIFDEPTLGLDPIGQSRILQLLKNLNNQGRTIFFSSHNLFQVQSICDRIGVIHQGEIRFIGTVEEFLAKHNTDSLEQAFLKEVTTNRNA